MKHFLIIINLDETNFLFVNRRDRWLKDTFISLAHIIVNFKHFVFVTLTGTYADVIIELYNSTGFKFYNVELPLLSCENV